ncbi:MAG: hypothetical protein NTZ56_00315 [Acidobacteria bacterium]|nr:hypothetical protein [Acidobacteriota bacterium]
MVICPECNSELEDYDEDELDVGDEFTCDECGENIRVASLGPLELELAEEDDDDEDEEDEDDEDSEEDDEDEDDDFDEDDDVEEDEESY